MTAAQQRDVVREAMASARLTPLEEQALWMKLTGRKQADLARAEHVGDSAQRECLARALRKIRRVLPQLPLPS